MYVCLLRFHVENTWTIDMKLYKRVLEGIRINIGFVLIYNLGYAL